MFGIGPMELMIVLGICVLLFGNRIPGIARSLGMSIMEFKKGKAEGEGTLTDQNPKPESSKSK